MKKKMTGTEIESKVCKYARETYDMLTYKFSSPQRRNVPDRIIVTLEGLVLWVEFKATGEPPRSGQVRELNRLADRNQRTAICDDVVAGEAFIDEMAEFSRETHAAMVDANRQMQELQEPQVIAATRIPTTRH